MGAGDDLDVEALLQRLQPAQRHAQARIGFPGGNGFEKLVRRAAVVDQLDIEVLLLEEAVIDGDRQRRKADRAGIPGELQFARCTGERGRLRCGPADRKFGEIDG